MNSTIRRPARRFALALGLVAAAWPVSSGSTPGAYTFLPAGVSDEASEPDRIYLAQANAALVESPVSFSSDQADRGEKRYAKDCEECHGKTLKGGLNGGAPLRGLSFEQKYADAPASTMFEFMSNEMPPNAPGRYSPSTYADLMAYILKRNGFRPGAPLPSDLDALDYLIIEK
jgi:mono/diheme cytochrome c family protein